METVLYILHVLVCVALLPIILLQSGKGGGVSAVFGGGGAGTVFGSRGASTFLTRMTTGAAILFMFTSMGLSYYASQTRSVVGDVPPAPATEELQKDPSAKEADSAPQAEAPGAQDDPPAAAPSETQPSTKEGDLGTSAAPRDDPEGSKNRPE